MHTPTVLGALSILAAASAASSDSTHRTEYAVWARLYHRSEEPSAGQLRAWVENREIVRLHNADTSNTWVAGMNQYSDMTPDEFKVRVLMKTGTASSPHDVTHNAREVPKLDNAPESFDWRDIGGVTPVQDQGSVGTCWAFSTTANIEGQYYQKTNTTMKLSEEFFVDCDGTADYDLKHADCSIFGGWPYLAYQFVMQAGGIPTEETYPYCAGTGECYPCMNGPEDLCGLPPYYCDRAERDKLCKTFAPATTVTDWRAVSSDEEEIAADLIATGPLSVLLDAQGLQYYKSGVWTGVNPARAHGGCSKTLLDHAVLLTGYGVETDGTPYWSIKNSWSADWGEDGYFRIVRGQGECGVNTAVTTAIM